jgi:hypothetical protein
VPQNRRIRGPRPRPWTDRAVAGITRALACSENRGRSPCRQVVPPRGGAPAPCCQTIAPGGQVIAPSGQIAAARGQVAAAAGEIAAADGQALEALAQAPRTASATTPHDEPIRAAAERSLCRACNPPPAAARSESERKSQPTAPAHAPPGRRRHLRHCLASRPAARNACQSRRPRVRPSGEQRGHFSIWPQ